jgi:hypothetical protein|eukprot:TRINITY_DN369_c1_g2_i1.p1 TRINITY_DN369_c1_g2~~TRINITY_DN369_c1_g2_i1.p1  ORF type:complete len:287 (+),score=87.63 TRINITY_DN369_c1_g2_i1:65-862(+)
MATAPEIANNAGDPEDEELMDVPEAEKASDPLFRAEIERVLDGTVFRGVVEEIEMGVVTKEKLYRIRYEDNDMEHFSAEQVLELRVQPKETSASQPLKRPADASAEEPVAKKPAVAGTADDAADAADESDGNVDAEEEEEEEEANDSNDVSKKPAGAGAKTNGVLDEADEAENEGEEEEEEEEDEEEDEQMEENGSSARQKPASADIAKKPSADAGDDEDATSTKKPASAVLKKPAADHGHIDMEEEEEETPPKVMKKPASRGAR